MRRGRCGGGERREGREREEGREGVEGGEGEGSKGDGYKWRWKAWRRGPQQESCSAETVAPVANFAAATMINDEGENVDLYIPRKW